MRVCVRVRECVCLSVYLFVCACVRMYECMCGNMCVRWCISACDTQAHAHPRICIRYITHPPRSRHLSPLIHTHAHTPLTPFTHTRMRTQINRSYWAELIHQRHVHNRALVRKVHQVRRRHLHYPGRCVCCVYMNMRVCVFVWVCACLCVCVCARACVCLRPRLLSALWRGYPCRVFGWKVWLCASCCTESILNVA